MLFVGKLLLATTVLAAQPEVPAERIYFSALDRDEIPVLGLTAADFIFRINSRPAEMPDFQPGTAGAERRLRLAVWILIDFNPNIPSDMITRQAGAAAGLLDRVHPDSVVGVQLVSDRAETLAPLGSDGDVLRKAFAAYASRRTELRVGRSETSVLLGAGGLVRAAELALEELTRYLAATPRLQGVDVRPVIVILSDGNVNPSYNQRPLLEAAGSAGVALYPVFVPRRSFGAWLERYFGLGEKTAGLGLVFGALRPGTRLLNLPRGNTDPNALTFSFLNILRDLEGKYSFAAPVAAGGRLRLDLRGRHSRVTVRLGRKTVP